MVMTEAAALTVLVLFAQQTTTSLPQQPHRQPQSAAGVATTAGCRTTADCSHLGACDAASSRCVCAPGWWGEHCEQLALEPLAEPSGLQKLLERNATSSWGGAAVVVREGSGGGVRYHMVYSELERHCGINSWLSNSVVRHAVSVQAPPPPPPPAPSSSGQTGAGGGEPRQLRPTLFEPREVLFPIFSHEPTLAVAPTGEVAMFFTHNAQPVTLGGTCNCSTGNSTLGAGACPPDWDKKHGRDPHMTLQTYMTFTRDFATWSTPVAVPQADPLTDTAFSATILSNGTIVAMTRTQVIVGASWRDVGSYKQVVTFKANHYGEGADIWHDPTTDVFHMLSHNGNLMGTTCGEHYSSVDLRVWTTHGCAYGAKGVQMADGTRRDFGRRERPHLLWAGSIGPGESPLPVALSTAVTSMPTTCIPIGQHPCLYRCALPTVAPSPCALMLGDLSHAVFWLAGIAPPRVRAGCVHVLTNACWRRYPDASYTVIQAIKSASNGNGG
jgi:hypothetical protein